MLAIATLTLRETARRRIALVVAVASATLVGLSTWGFRRLNASFGDDHLAALAVVSVLCVFLAFVFSAVLAIGGAFLASPAIAGDVESGIVLAVLPRPLTRTEYVLGRWLGLAVPLVLFAALVGAIELAAIDLATGYRPPHPLAAFAYLAAESVVLSSLALAASTRLPALAGGLLAVAAFGLAWIAGIVATIADGLHNAPLLDAMTVVSLVVPSDGLWRGAAYELQPVAIAMASEAATRGGAVNPFFVVAPPTLAFVVWSVLWVVGVVTLAVVSFVRRDL